MAEPGLDSPEAARFYEWGPAFSDLAQDLTPDQKHRYTQWRSMQRQRDLSRTADPEVLRKRGEESRALRDMFIKPNSDEDALFQMLEEGENEEQSKNPTPFGKEFGSHYASPKAAAARQAPTAAPRSTAPAQGYTDLNSRYVPISERTFLQPSKTSARSEAAKAMLRKGK